MDKVEIIKNDKAYIKCKLLVKNWEKDFKTKYSRTPSKFDIKEAPAKVKYAYKKYFQLKSAALETSLSVCDIDEPMGSPESDRQILASLGKDGFDSDSDNLLPDLPSGQELEKLLSKSIVSENTFPGKSNAVKLANEEQSNCTLSGIKNKDIKPLSPFTENLSKKLFQSKKFSLRNPRKSLITKSQSSAEDIDVEVINKENYTNNSYQDLQSPHEVETFDSISTISSQNDLDVRNATNSITKSISNVHSPAVRRINEGWLKRATGVICKNETNDLVVSSVNSSENFGLANIKTCVLEKPCDFVENSESEEEDNLIKHLKPALKKRKLHQSPPANKTLNEDFGKQSVDIVKKVTEKKSKTKLVNKVKSTSKNENSQHKPPDIQEYILFGLEKEITPRHLNINDALNNVLVVKNENSIGKNDDKYDKLNSKIKNGTLNDNFVKINIEKKVFVRGKKGINYTKYKKQQWKDKKALHAGMEFPEAGKVTCFKCGGSGHMARYCKSQKADALLPLESYTEDDIPTLDDMQDIVFKETSSQTIPDQLKLSIYTPSMVPESFQKVLDENRGGESYCDIEPIYCNYQQETPDEMRKALSMFGHTSFRPGQEEAILRILCGMSTLLILSTGGGKSLCYQLPAFIYSQHHKCITLVISPLVSLMEDQVLSMPDFLKAGCLHTNQSATQRKKIVEYLKAGEINILLISPEALISGDSSNGFAGLFKSLPKIAFACIDEAHCVSQWSHNFRPSYLMICRVLREKLNVKCILGLTATASKPTINSIITHINVPDKMNGVITNPTLPDNLKLSISFEKDKDRALILFFNSDRIKTFNSIIVYCIRRDECERIAAMLRSCLQEQGKVNMEKQSAKRKRMSYIAEAYHAGMSAAQRKKIQKNFMDGTLRIIVATVAFGMGINKSDIRCIIHYNMPSSFESYVQEVGRAGRDGGLAYCHAFMSNSNNDKNELLKHIHSNTIDRPIIRKLLQKVFIPCNCKVQDESNDGDCSVKFRCKGHEVGIPIDSTVEELDLPSENISTLLCYIELHEKQYIKVLSNANTMCKISSYGGPQKILEAAKACPPLAMAYLIENKKDPDVTKKSTLEFNVIDVAASIGWESGMTKFHLKNLEWVCENGSSKRSHLKVEFNTLGFRIKAPGDLTSVELDKMLDDLHETVVTQEKTMLGQLEECSNAFKKFGNYSLENSYLSEEILQEKSNELKSTIRDYFERDNSFPVDITLQVRPLDEERVASDVRSLICLYKDCTFTGRSIARIFQGISSPNYPALVWGRCKFWRSHIHEDFYGIMKIATQQIIQMKM